MAKVTFSKLKMRVKNPPIEVALPDSDIKLEILTYLPQAEKANFIDFVIQNSMDKNGCFSPIRLETYFSIALAKWYGQISFTDKQLADIAKTYDILQSNDVFDLIAENVPKDEYEFIEAAVNDTAADVSRFNNSAAGLLSAMSSDATNLGDQFDKILGDIQDGKGLEQLAVIRDIVGKKD